MMSAPAPVPDKTGFSGHGGRLTIDLGALVQNYRDLASMAAPATCAAAVKGDAYGHGLEPVAKALLGAGCHSFFVAHISEAQRLRAQLGDDPKIYVLNGLLPGLAPDLAAIGATPVLGSLEEIAEWQAFCRAAGETKSSLITAIMVDTGFNRLGLSAADVAAIAGDKSLIDGLNVSWLMSHFACADDPGHPQNAAQMARFDAARKIFPEARHSMANSGALLGNAATNYDMVRVGLALYGGAALNSGPNTMRAVARLEARVIQCRKVELGETIGYAATYKFNKPGRVALLSVGYADGFLRALSGSNNGKDNRPGGLVFFAGNAAPVIGRVSMDVVAVDVSDLPQDLGCRGSWAEIIGPHQSASNLAKSADTIDYEVFTSFGSRYERKIIEPSDS